METKLKESELTHKIIGAATEVHRNLGPGLLASAYKACLAIELTQRGIKYESPLSIPLEYKGTMIKNGLVIDFVVEDKVVLLIRSIPEILPIHRAEILTNMKLGKKCVGLILNFNAPRLMEGLERFVA